MKLSTGRMIVIIVKKTIDFNNESAIADECGKKPTGEKSNKGRGHRRPYPMMSYMIVKISIFIMTHYI